MKNILRLMAVCMLFAATACELDENSPVKSVGEGFTLVGKSSVETKTAFGTLSGSSIPFQWEKGDVIYVNGHWSKELQEGGNTAEFLFETGSVQPGDAVYFGSADCESNTNKCDVWTLPYQDGSLRKMHNNGDFGYAIIGEDNTFALEHYTSYLWLDTYSSSVTSKVCNITITAENDIVGICEFDEASREFKDDIHMIDEEDEYLKQTKSIFIEFMDEDYELAPKQLLPNSSDEQIWAVAITFPVNTGTLRIDYAFEDGTCASYNYNSKDLAAGKTYRISQEIKSSDLYELKVLTFEDEDVQFAPYSLDYCGMDITLWSDLVAEDQYMADLIYSFNQSEGDYYNWNDEGNTFLAHHFPYNYYSYSYWGGGHAISNYVSSDYETYGDYMSQLTVYNERASEQLSQTGGGHNDSNNFSMHFGYIDGSDFNQTDELSNIYFSDGKARIIDHMWVANNTYAINCFINGNGLTEGMGENDTFYVTASGFDEDGNLVGSCQIYLAKGRDYLSEWTKWDLSSLGKVVSVQFNVCGSSDNGYGFSQPAYFAYDDVAVRFEVE